MKKPAINLALAALLTLLPSGPAKAQFYTLGNDPGLLKWSQVMTDSYRIIYPAGFDSLATVYAVWLERVQQPVGGSLGFTPNQYYRKPMPVVLHPYSAIANGMVTWAPRRMELYTVPDPSDPIPLDWPLQLTVHESRHAAQMQAACGGTVGKTGRILTGDLFAGAMSAVLGGSCGMEGDAVMAETSLTASGRGRNADFLEYQRACFAEGDFRDFWKWLYGSQKKYTPDHYTTGYISRAGMKMFCGFDAWPYNSIGKRLNRTFPVIADSLAAIWSGNAAQRAPFMEFERLTSGKSFTEYTSLCGDADALYAIREGLRENPRIVNVGNGRTVAGMSQNVSRLKYNSANRTLVWSEIRKDPRWEQRSFSEIWSFDPATGRKHRLTRGTRYFNPAASEDGRKIAVVEYPEDGTSAIVVLNAFNGTVLDRKEMPSGLQATETVWIGDRVFFSAIDLNGISIYSQDSMKALLEPVFFKIKELGSHSGAITFVSDRTGVDELYSLDTATASVLQLTCSEQGSGNHFFADDSLYFSYLSAKGRDICVIAESRLPVRAVDFGKRWEDPLAESLSAAEPVVIDYGFEPVVSQPRKYSRLGNAVKIHSWVPVYFNYDAVDDLSFNTLMTSAGLGATVFFQNDLSTLSGTASVSAWTPGDGLKNSVHAKITYSGLYPVVEASVDVSDTEATYLRLYTDENGELDLSANTLDVPSANASIRAYIPFNLSSGGWSRGLVPQIEGNFTNSVASYGSSTGFMGSIAFKLRGYAMQPTAPSCIYPRWGLGIEAGHAFRPGLSEMYTSATYGYVYGYVPGLLKTHGLRLSILAQKSAKNGILAFPYANAAPRSAPDIVKELARYPLHGKFTLDYALPFGAADWSFLEPFTFVRNFELTAHYDCSFFKTKKTSGTVNGIGAELCARLGNLLWIPYTTRIGIGYSYNFGDIEVKPHHLNMVFNVDF